MRPFVLPGEDDYDDLDASFDLEKSNKTIIVAGTAGGLVLLTLGN
jgi:hypothetical protein